MNRGKDLQLPLARETVGYRTLYSVLSFALKKDTYVCRDQKLVTLIALGVRDEREACFSCFMLLYFLTFF